MSLVFHLSVAAPHTSHPQRLPTDSNKRDQKRPVAGVRVVWPPFCFYIARLDCPWEGETSSNGRYWCLFFCNYNSTGIHKHLCSELTRTIIRWSCIDFGHFMSFPTHRAAPTLGLEVPKLEVSAPSSAQRICSQADCEAKRGPCYAADTKRDLKRLDWSWLGCNSKLC